MGYRAAVACLLLLAAFSGCGDSGASSNEDASPEQGLDESETQAEETPTATPFIAKLWQETEVEQEEDGSTARQRIEFGDLAGASDFDAPEGFQGLATACDVDYQRDALIPGKLSVENTTKRFSIEITSGVFVGIRATLAGEDPYPELPAVDVAQGFSAGPSCEVASGAGNGSVAAGVDFTIEGGGAAEQNFLVVVHDYYSPANPQGRKEDLANLRAGVSSPAPLFTDWEQTCVAASVPLDGETVRLDGGPIVDRQFDPSELPPC